MYTTSGAQEPMMLSGGNSAGYRLIRKSISSRTRKPRQSCTFYMTDWWLSLILINRNLCKSKLKRHSARLMLELQLDSVGSADLANAVGIRAQSSNLTLAG